MQTKLTLRLEEQLIARAKSYAALAGKLVSQLMADYFKSLSMAQILSSPQTDLRLDGTARFVR